MSSKDSRSLITKAKIDCYKKEILHTSYHRYKNSKQNTGKTKCTIYRSGRSGGFNSEIQKWFHTESQLTM